MATSGSTNFNLTRNEIIRGALRLIGAIATGETPSAAEINDASESLNMMVKSWMMDGVHLWTLTEGTLFCQKNLAHYSIPGTYVANTYVTTAIATAATIGAGSIIVDSIAGIANGDHVGILLDNGSMQWTTVNGAPAGVTITLSATLTAAAAVDNVVYTYTTGAGRPLRVRNMRSKSSDGNEIPFYSDVLSRSDYMHVPNKSSTGTPVQGYYDPQLATGTIYLWPTPDTASHRVVFTYERMIEDFDNIDDNADFPQECLNALKWNLALEIFPEYYPKENPSQFHMAKATILREALLNWNTDNGCTTFEPEMC